MSIGSPIDIHALHARQQSDPALQIVDVRGADEWAEGHVAGSVHIPLGELTERASTELDEARPVAVICRSGGRAVLGAQALADWDEVLVVADGGVPDWEASGYPTESGA